MVSERAPMAKEMVTPAPLTMLVFGVRGPAPMKLEAVVPVKVFHRENQVRAVAPVDQAADDAAKATATALVKTCPDPDAVGAAKSPTTRTPPPISTRA
jgi:hypothetical protein